MLSKCCHNIDHLLRSFHYGYKLLQLVAGCHSSFSLTYLTSLLLFVCVWLRLCAEYELLGFVSTWGRPPCVGTMCVTSRRRDDGSSSMTVKWQSRSNLPGTWVTSTCSAEQLLYIAMTTSGITRRQLHALILNCV